MIYFKNRPFCSAKCDTVDCHMRWTKALQEEALEWWGGRDPPIKMENISGRCLAYTQPKFTSAGASLKKDETNK